MITQLLQKMEESNKDAVFKLIRDEIAKEGKAWAIHLSLFPLVQRVLNPPFINPHLPKMYSIYREFLPYLMLDEIPPLVKLEINEYTQRSKLKELPKPPGKISFVSFPEIETIIREGGPEKAAALLNAFLEQKGKRELARHLLLLGSGYLNQSLGHSVSCTAFIILEMFERSDEDSWPALATLADYFCKGQFYTTPAIGRTVNLPSKKALAQHLLRASSGSGIVNLHHTITRYAVERVRHLLNEEEYAHMINCWIEFMGDKSVEAPSPISMAAVIPDYNGFYKEFSRGAEKQTLAMLTGVIDSKEGRQQLGRYLIKGVCDLYQGSYNPHFLTGLGSALWVVNTYWDQPPLAISALRQYLNYFFTEAIR